MHVVHGISAVFDRITLTLDGICTLIPSREWDIPWREILIPSRIWKM